MSAEPARPGKAPYALVSGGAGHLGTAVCERLLGQGLEVVVLDRTSPRLSGVNHLELDLADEESTDGVLSGLLADRGAPVALVMCQGWSPKGEDGKALPESLFPVSVFRQVLDVNLTSCYLLLRTVVPAMAEAGTGRVVSVGSAASLTGRTTASAAYAAAKAGLDAIVRRFAVRYGPHGVLVNSVAPGKIENPGWPESPETTTAYQREIPVGRLAGREEVAKVIAFLASDHNSYLTGQTVIVDGGRLA